MRGKAKSNLLILITYRITPAYAGKSIGAGDANPDTGDHPRLCGEKPRKKSDGLTVYGSPPPMRGKVLLRQKSIILYGITPAYAGKS